jgi:phage N-6-adenine-methyltransferase
MLNKHLFSSLSDEWETPQELFDILDKEFHFIIDICATEENSKCKLFYTKDDDALKIFWPRDGWCWMNPPYGRQIGKFIKKAFNESSDGSKIVCLLPSRTDTKWWHDYCMHGEIRFIKGRLKMLNRQLPSYNGIETKKSSAPFPSAIVIFDINNKYNMTFSTMRGLR